MLQRGMERDGQREERHGEPRRESVDQTGAGPDGMAGKHQRERRPFDAGALGAAESLLEFGVGKFVHRVRDRPPAENIQLDR